MQKFDINFSIISVFLTLFIILLSISVFFIYFLYIGLVIILISYFFFKDKIKTTLLLTSLKKIK